MVTAAVVRTLALAMPEAVESSHFEVTDFRVRKKIFATVHPDGKTGALLRLDPDEVAALVGADPETFRRAGSNARAVIVTLARVDRAQYQHLLIEAWRGTAPKKLVAEYDGAAPAAGKARKRGR